MKIKRRGFATRTESSINCTNVDIYSQNNEPSLGVVRWVIKMPQLDKGRWKICLVMLNSGQLANTSHHMAFFAFESFPNKLLKIALWLIPNCIFQQGHSSCEGNSLCNRLDLAAP